MAAVIYIFNHAFIKSGLLLMITGVIASMNEKAQRESQKLTGAGKGLTALSILLSGRRLGARRDSAAQRLHEQGRAGARRRSASSWVVLGIVIGGRLLTLIITRTWQLIFVKPAPKNTPARHRACRARSGAVDQRVPMHCAGHLRRAREYRRADSRAGDEPGSLPAPCSHRRSRSAAGRRIRHDADAETSDMLVAADLQSQAKVM
ncbi:MAG: hypothetical protein U0521_01995 [Anaerolineae bacterium]